MFSEAKTFSLQLPYVDVPGEHLLCSLELCFLHLFFSLFLQSSNVRARLLPARVPLGQELQAVCGADGLPEEALLAQHPLDGVILPHLVLLYDLGNWPLVRSWTRRQGGPQQDKSSTSSEEEGSQKEHSIQRLMVWTVRGCSFHYWVLLLYRVSTTCDISCNFLLRSWKFFFFLIGTVLNNVLLQRTLEELSGLWKQELFILDPWCINLKNKQKSTAP